MAFLWSKSPPSLGTPFFGFGVVLGRRRWGCLNGGMGKEKEEMGIALIKLYTRINKFILTNLLWPIAETKGTNNFFGKQSFLFHVVGVYKVDCIFIWAYSLAAMQSLSPPRMAP